jgi:hypothetical protein
VAILERQLYREVTFQTTPDGAGGQRPQQLSSLCLTGRRDLVVSEFGDLPGELKVGHYSADDLPGVGQRQPHTIDEVGLVDLAVLGTLEQCGGNVEGHGFLRYECAVRAW